MHVMKSIVGSRMIPAALGTLILCSSCSTINVVHRETYSEGPEIRGTERFKMDVDRFARLPKGTDERIAIVPERIDRHYKVEHWRKRWDEVERKRYCSVAGIHDEYGLEKDVSIDFLCCGISAVGSPFWALGGVFGDLDVSNPAAWVVSGLPLVSCNLGAVHETVEKHVELKQVNPLDKVELANFGQLERKRFDWVVLNPDGSRRGKGRVRGPELIEIPWVDWVLDHPETTFFSISVSSSDLDLVGNTNGVLNVDLKDAVHRRWPDEADRPEPGLTVHPDLLDADATNSLKQIGTGQRGWVRLDVDSGMFSSSAYLVEPFVECAAVSGLVGELPPARRWLKRWSSTRFDVPVCVPLDCREEALDVSVGVRDAFGRVYGASTLTIPVTQTPLPDLIVHMAEIIRNETDPKAGQLMITVRNRGSGPADKVLVELLSCDGGMSADEKQVRIDKIEPFGRESVSLDVRLGDRSARIVPVHLQLRENLGLPPVDASLDVPIPE